MPKVKKVTARKDYPQFGIKKGDVHYFTQMKTGPRSSKVMRQKTPFKRSQLTNSEYLAALYDWEDSKGDIATLDDLRASAEAIREIAEEQQQKLDNMPEGLQQGDTGQMIQARIDACEGAADELDDIVNDWESMEDGEDYEGDESEEDFIERARNVEVSE